VRHRSVDLGYVNMTPQTAARLRIYDEAGSHALVDERRRLAPVVTLRGGRPVGASGAETVRPGPLRRESLRRRLLATADLAAAVASLLFVLTAMGNGDPQPAILVGTPLVVLLFKVAGLYDRDQLRVVHSTLDETPLLLQLTGLYVLGVTILAPTLTSESLASGQMAALWLSSFLATVAGRMIARWVAAKVSPLERCLVIGEPELADRFREKLKSSHARATVIATLPLANHEFDGWNTPESLGRIVRELRVERVIIAPTTTDSRGVTELIRVAKAADVRVSVLPRMFEVVGSAVEFDDVDGLTMLGVRSFGLSRSSRALKRAFDLAATSIGLLAVAPILAVIAGAIRLESKGPVLFRQTRVGRDGKHFQIYKFRSMIADAETQKDRLRALNEVGDGMFKIADDPRVTRVGNILRKTSLDEMPQLLNVLRGEMSLVGPRPLVTDEDAHVRGLDRSRLHLTPGMTGPWQVLGARVPMQEMVGIDYLYVASWSLWADLKLLVRTVRHVLRRGNV
jgi:exopolysaccharide biosynthesis polyprenyl glycosylphosphotransferase